MRIIEKTTEFHIEERTAVAIGKFDGLHLGHQALLAEVLRAKKEGLLTAVFTFDPSPIQFFGKEPQKLLTPKEEKRKLLEEMGIDILYEFPLNEQTAKTPPDGFVKEYLVEKLHAKKIVCGPDLSFGDRGLGNLTVLESMAKDCDYEVVPIQKVYVDGEEVSSSLVREYVKKGNTKKVLELLGKPYAFEGEIVKGKQLGSKIGMPTANIIPDEDKLLPPYGVYFATALLEGEKYYGVFNVGLRPTVEDTMKANVEMHIYGITEPLYGKRLTIYCDKYQREEMTFASLEALKDRIAFDLQAGREYFGLN